MLLPAIIGIPVSSAAAFSVSRSGRSQRTLIRAGFVATTVGMVLLLALVREHSSIATFVPGLLLMGLGIGVMLTSSVNVVQSSFPEACNEDISGRIPVRLEPRVVARHRPRRLGPGRRLVPRRQAVRPLHHHSRGDLAGRPRARAADPPPEGRGDRAGGVTARPSVSPRMSRLGRLMPNGCRAACHTGRCQCDSLLISSALGPPSSRRVLRRR